MEGRCGWRDKCGIRPSIRMDENHPPRGYLHTAVAEAYDLHQLAVAALSAAMATCAAVLRIQEHHTLTETCHRSHTVMMLTRTQEGWSLLWSGMNKVPGLICWVFIFERAA